MSDLICRKSMMRCQTPGMCSPHGGCQDTINAELKAVNFDLHAGQQMMQEEIARLKAENEDGLAVLRTQKEQLDCYIKDAERYRWLEKNAKDKAMGISNEYATDWRRKYSFPLLLSQSAVSSPIALSEAIDAAMAQEQ